MRLLRPLLGIAILVSTAYAADTAFVKILTFPQAVVADARSTVSVTAEIRDGQGRIAPNGTQVFFAGTLGTFRETSVTTLNGFARATFVAGGVSGISRITVNVPALNATSTADIELASSRDQLASSREYVEIDAATRLEMTSDTKVLTAEGSQYGVSLRYRNVALEADTLQLNIPTMELRARKARLRIAGQSRDYDDLFLNLDTRVGVGTTNFMAKSVTGMTGEGRYFGFKVEERLRYGVVQISGTEVASFNGAVNRSQFELLDVSESNTVVMAKKAVVFPRREVQFHRADLVVGGEKVFGFPLFQFSLNGGTPFLTEQILNVKDNKLALNYPHFLTLKPGQTSLLRLRMGENYGRSLGATTAAFLDYELNWNRGDSMEGGLRIDGLLREDWGFSARQYLRFDDRTSLNAQIDLPAHQSVFGSMSLSRQFDGFSVAMNGAATKSLRSLPYQNQQLSLVAEKDPTKVGRLPVQLFYGLTATHSEQKVGETEASRSVYGLRFRGQLLPQRLDSSTTVNSYVAISRLEGQNASKGLSIQSTSAITRRLGSQASVALSYDYLDDGFNAAFLGRHRLGVQAFYAGGRSRLSFFGGRSLGVDRLNLYGDFSYRLGPDWRVSSSYTYDRYLSGVFLDYNAVLAYRLGLREIGLTWSRRTGRFGIQVLGASF